VTLREQLIRDEGKHLTPYRDTLGLLTIGVGHNLDAHGISEEVCDLLLTEDIARTLGGLRARLGWYADLAEPRRAVLENMAFNMGVGGLLGFRKMLAAIQAGAWSKAADEMLDSDWARQVGDRAKRLAEQMRSGTWIE
jgi:lysozyme